MTEREARVCMLTFQDGKILLRIGPGDHTCDEWELTENQLRGILIDGLHKLLVSPWR